MTQEEKDLLLKDLCARLPYGVICDRLGKPKKLLGVHPTKVFPLEFDNGEYMPSDYALEDIKPYLRPLESQTDEEMEERGECVGDVMRMDYYYSHHLDCHQLIRRGLALEAPEGMYKLQK